MIFRLSGADELLFKNADTGVAFYCTGDDFTAIIAMHYV